MQEINESSFQIFCKLSQKVQKIQSQLGKETITQEKRVAYHRELETLQDSISDFRDKARAAGQQANQFFAQFDDMESAIISLYRVVEERFEELEIKVISREAFELSASVTKGKMAEVAKQVNKLRHNVLYLFQHRRPSLQNRKIIHLALKLTDHVDEILSGTGKPSKDQLQLVQLLKTLLKEAIYKADTYVNPAYGELAMELYEIADLLHHRREKEGRVRLDLIRSRLTCSQQKRLEEAANFPKEMVRLLLEIIDEEIQPDEKFFVPILA